MTLIGIKNILMIYNYIMYLEYVDILNSFISEQQIDMKEETKLE